MTTHNGDDLKLERVPTGIGGLDRILRGGLLSGGVYIIEGTPGTGKTILANQMCFNHVAAGGRVAFVTVLAESHTRMLQHLQPMTFFHEGAIPDRLYYVSGFRILENEGLKGVVDLLRREIKGHHATLLVLDGFATTEESASSPREFKKFVHEVQSHAAALECTILLLTNGSERTVSPEYTMVDGMIRLEDTLFHQRTERTLQVSKFRGSDFLPGRHPFRITSRGLEIFPRVEAAFAVPSVRDDYEPRRQSTGIATLDEILGGGLLAETSNGLYGPTGIGKTTLGLQYVAQSSAAEPGTFYGFFESPERLRVRAQTLGIDMRGLERRGAVELIWCPQGEHILDELGHRMIEAVRRRGVKRLFIDGYGALVESATTPGRMTRFVSTLSNELRAMKATVIMSMESRNVLGTATELPSIGLSSLLEGLILMRYTELEGRIRRVLSVTKIRESSFDPRLREFEITPRGIEIGAPIHGVEAALSGFAHEPRAVRAEYRPQGQRRED
ncbi:MAG TPA: ATPase domain-containing protein [Steroidobacteraceae bacterium]|nr:ATPase domain-containing protein [Steroidobacteraceae bacterium]